MSENQLTEILEHINENLTTIVHNQMIIYEKLKTVIELHEKTEEFH